MELISKTNRAFRLTCVLLLAALLPLNPLPSAKLFSAESGTQALEFQARYRRVRGPCVMIDGIRVMPFVHQFEVQVSGKTSVIGIIPFSDVPQSFASLEANRPYTIQVRPSERTRNAIREHGVAVALRWLNGAEISVVPPSK